MKVVVLQSNYIPWKGYFDLISEADVFCFYDDVKYTKNDWRNRNKLIDTKGTFWLTIPISADSVNFKINEVKITGSGWQKKHFKTIIATYAKAPQVKIIEPLLTEIYLDNEWQFLSELNQHLIVKIAEYIGLKTKFTFSGDYKIEGDKVGRLVELIKQIGGTHYISGPSARGYLTGADYIFSENSIKLTYKNYGPYKPYPQNSVTFTNNVSILDTLMFVPKELLMQYITSPNDSL